MAKKERWRTRWKKKQERKETVTICVSKLARNRLLHLFSPRPSSRSLFPSLASLYMDTFCLRYPRVVCVAGRGILLIEPFCNDTPFPFSSFDFRFYRISSRVPNGILIRVHSESRLVTPSTFILSASYSNATYLTLFYRGVQ